MANKQLKPVPTYRLLWALLIGAALGSILILSYAIWAIKIHPSELRFLKEHSLKQLYLRERLREVFFHKQQQLEKFRLLIGDSHILFFNSSAIDGTQINYGIGGDTLTAIHTRLTEDVDLKKVAQTIIIGGINDIRKKAPVEDSKRAIEATAKYLETTPTVWLTIPPTPHARASQADIDQLNRWIMDACKTMQACELLDLSVLLREPNTFELCDCLLEDQFHLNANGYLRLAKALEKYVDYGLQDQQVTP